MVITAVSAITPIGNTAYASTAAVRAGISQLQEADEYFDIEGNSIQSASIEAINDFAEPIDRLTDIAEKCISRLIDHIHNSLKGRKCCLFFCAPSEERDGALFDVAEDDLPQKIIEQIRPHVAEMDIRILKQGNPAAFYALHHANKIIENDPAVACIIVGVDSLLNDDFLDWAEEDERLRSESEGRHQGFAPGEGCCVLLIENNGFVNGKRPVLAHIDGIGLSNEPAPITSGKPSFANGLTQACLQAMENAQTNADEIKNVLCDLDGEFYRAKEWGFTDIRCFGKIDPPRKLYHPAEYYGSVGAASAALLLCIVASSRGWMDGHNLIFCSDDHGTRGAAILYREWHNDEVFTL